MLRYMENQYLIAPKLCNISINKVLVTEFITMNVSHNDVSLI